MDRENKFPFHAVSVNHTETAPRIKIRSALITRAVIALINFSSNEPAAFQFARLMNPRRNESLPLRIKMARVKSRICCRIAGYTSFRPLRPNSYSNFGSPVRCPRWKYGGVHSRWGICNPIQGFAFLWTPYPRKVCFCVAGVRFKQRRANRYELILARDTASTGLCGLVDSPVSPSFSSNIAQLYNN